MRDLEKIGSELHGKGLSFHLRDAAISMRHLAEECADAAPGTGIVGELARMADRIEILAGGITAVEGAAREAARARSEEETPPTF